jgi:hypothetical protein
VCSIKYKKCVADTPDKDGNGKKKLPNKRPADFTFGVRFPKCILSAEECSNPRHLATLETDEGFTVPNADTLPYRKSEGRAGDGRRSKNAKLQPGEYCHSKAMCEKYCVDPSPAAIGSIDSKAFVNKVGRAIVSIFSKTKETNRWFCFDVKTVNQCESVAEEREVARGRRCHGAASFVHCKNDMCVRKGEYSEVPDPATGGMILVTAKTAKCMTECSKTQVCTGAPGMGLQQRTLFKDEPSGNRPAGSFERVPTSPWDTRVFATGKCYECKIGVDGHFRCPVRGRRQMLMEAPFKHLKLANRSATLASQVESTLFGGADLCFDNNPIEGLRLDSDASKEERNAAKSEVTVVVCNERVEVPAKATEGEFNVWYAGTMMLEGAFKRSWANGLVMTDPDIRVFNFGFEIAVPPAAPPPHAFFKVAPKFENTKKNATVNQCGFVRGDEKPTQYRSMLVELYTKYMRAGAKERGRNKPCMLVPNM